MTQYRIVPKKLHFIVQYRGLFCWCTVAHYYMGFSNDCTFDTRNEAREYIDKAIAKRVAIAANEASGVEYYP